MTTTIYVYFLSIILHHSFLDQFGLFIFIFYQYLEPKLQSPFITVLFFSLLLITNFWNDIWEVMTNTFYVDPWGYIWIKLYLNPYSRFH